MAKTPFGTALLSAAVLGSVPCGGQQLFVESLAFPAWHDAEAFALAVNPLGEGLLVGQYEYRSPLALMVSPEGGALTTEEWGSYESALADPQGWVVAGTLRSSTGNVGGAVLAKFSHQGNPLWQLFIGGADTPVPLAPAPENGSFFAAGRSSQDGDLPGPLVGRLNQAGELLWLRAFAMPSLRVNDVCSAPDGSLLLVGSWPGFGFVSLWSPQGQPQWTFRLPEGTDLQRCAFGGAAGWLVAGAEDAGLWLATLDSAGHLRRQVFVEGPYPLSLDGAGAAEGWTLSAHEGTAYGRAYFLWLPWDLVTLANVGVRGSFWMQSAGMGRLPDGRFLLAGTETSHSYHHSSPFLVKYAGNIGDFWECWRFDEGYFWLRAANHRLEEWALAFSSENPSIEPLASSARFLETPERYFACVDRHNPVSDLELEGTAAMAPEFGKGYLRLTLKARNRGAEPAERVSLRLWVGASAPVITTPEGYDCSVSGAPCSADCWCGLGELRPGDEVALSFVVRGTPYQLRGGIFLGNHLQYRGNVEKQ